jgi:hypothetical protein
MVICQGCGRAFDVPAGYTRNKVQCPDCGVICPVAAGSGAAQPPARAKQAAGAPARSPGPRPSAPSLEDEAAAWLTADAAAPPPAPEAAQRQEAPPPDEESAPPPPAARGKPGARILCRRCGRAIRKQRECPDCDAADEPLPAEPAAPLPVGLSAHGMELDEPAAPADDEDDSPYVLADKLAPSCPKCHKDMTPGAVLCAACGFNVRTRKKAGRTYQPLARSWEADLSMQARLGWFAGAQAAHLVLTLMAAADGYATPFLVAWPLLALLLCFVLGTYARTDITRDTRGRVTVVVLWRFCWVPLAPRTTEVRGFEGVTTGTWCDAGLWEWLIFGSLLCMAVVPGLIWWYVAIYQPHFHVALAQDHGHAAVYVYRGRSDAQMNDIARTLCEASGLRLVN